MIIPKLHYISQGETPTKLLENIQKACTSGIELIVLRYEDASEKKALKLAKEAIKITSHFQTRLLISDYYKVAKTIKADGVHFENVEHFSTSARQFLHSWQIIGCTATTLKECEILVSNNVDYIALSSFRNTNTSLGLEGYTEITKTLNTETPILGYGNITLNDVKGILKTGISGIAVSDAITKNFNSIKTFNELLNASSTQEQRHTF